MADASRIYQLLKKRRDKTISEPEEEELNAWSDESQANKEFIDRDIGPDTIAWHMEVLLGTTVDDRLGQLLHAAKKMGPLQLKIEDTSDLALPDEPVVFVDDEPLPRKTSGKRVLAICMIAAVIIFLAWGVWLLTRSGRGQVVGDQIAKAERPLLKIGTDTLYLDTLREGAVAFRQGSIQIRKMDVRHIKYWFRSDTNKREPLHALRTSIIIPDSKDSAGWQVSLPDGSRAVLYSGVMSVPPVGNDPLIKRGVSLAGNAFFDIVRDSVHPFLITTAFATMQVRGTLFSVEADNSVRGDSIDVAMYTGNMDITSGGRTRSIRKGQLALICRRCEDIQLSQVSNMRYYLPWKNPVFDFSHQPLYIVMNILKKWYDMNGVRYGRNVDTSATEKFNGGAVSKDQSLYSLLDAIEPKDMTLRVEDKTRTIIVDAK